MRRRAKDKMECGVEVYDRLGFPYYFPDCGMFRLYQRWGGNEQKLQALLNMESKNEAGQPD